MILFLLGLLSGYYLIPDLKVFIKRLRKGEQ